jgi:hypothetical protein
MFTSLDTYTPSSVETGLTHASIAMRGRVHQADDEALARRLQR